MPVINILNGIQHKKLSIFGALKKAAIVPPNSNTITSASAATIIDITQDNNTI